MNEPKIYCTIDYREAANECAERNMQTFAAMLNQAADESSRAYEVLNHSASFYGMSAYQIARYILTGKRSGNQ